VKEKLMKITTVREIVQKGGNKTVITIEDEVNGSDLNQLERHLGIIGFYDSQSLLFKLKRFYQGKK